MSKSRLKTLDARIAYRVARSKHAVFIRDDFQDLADYDQVGRVLRGLVAKGRLIKIGYGLYARAKTSAVSGRAIPEKALPALAREALERLGVDWEPTSAEQAYNDGQSTQVPTGRQIAVKGRVARQIGYAGTYVDLVHA